eukprot:5455869-Amphidinium_carterae.1
MPSEGATMDPLFLYLHANATMPGCRSKSALMLSATFVRLGSPTRSQHGWRRCAASLGQKGSLHIQT